jgi:transcriptional regulator
MNTEHGLEAVHLPLLLDGSRGPYGVLQGHVARANTIWQEAGDGMEALAIFQGPQHYISPNWYASKREHGKVVPTWNYAIVHARGPMKWIHDRQWLRTFLDEITKTHEQTQTHPWQVTDAPADYIERMLEAIVGFEIPISSIAGKWKLSQNRSAADRAGVIAGLNATPSDDARSMASLILHN